MSKLIHTEWGRFFKEEQLETNTLTASRNRKLTVTTIRDAGATREEQTLLARHMAHTAVLDTVQQKFKVS